MDVRRLARSMGAEVTGVDLRRLDDATFETDSRSIPCHQVLVIRDQELTPEAQIAFSRRFGPLEDQLNAHYTVEGYPEVLVLSNDIKDGKPVGLIDGGDFWHSDSSHRDRPSMATMLYAVKNPDQGGDTEFANMYAAYETLPEDLKRRIAGLKGVHAVSKLKNKRVTVSARRPTRKDFYERRNPSPTRCGRWCAPIRRRAGRHSMCRPASRSASRGCPEEEADEILDRSSPTKSATNSSIVTDGGTGPGGLGQSLRHPPRDRAAMPIPMSGPCTARSSPAIRPTRPDRLATRWRRHRHSSVLH